MGKGRSNGIRAVVAGAGMAGLCVAFRLLEAGCDVICCDAAATGAASQAALGYVAPPSNLDAPSDVVTLGALAFQRFGLFLRDLQSMTGERVFVNDRGYMHVGLSEEEQLEDIAASWESVNLRCLRLNGDQARSQEPLLGPSVKSGLLLQDALSVIPVQLIAALRRGIAELGGDIRSGERLRGLEVVNGVCLGVLLETGSVTADWTVVATGSWTNRVLNGITLDDISPIRGQVAVLRARGGDVFSRPISTSGLLDMMPRPGGELLIGRSYESAGYDPIPTAQVICEILGKALAVAPQVGEYEFVRAYSGLRPCTADRRPLIGPHPTVANLIVASGHCQDGILLGPITGDMVACHITGNGKYLELVERFRPR